MDKKYLGVILLIIALLLMYFGTTMFYNTGLGVADLNVHKSDSNDTQYEVSYKLLSVRGFNKVICEYTLLGADNQELGHGTDELNDIKDGSFPMDNTINVDNTSQEVKKIEIKLHEFDESNNQKQIYDQTFDI